MKRTLFVFLLLLVLMSCLLYSCKEQTPTITPQTQAAITEATIVPAPETQTSDLALIESNTEEGTVSVPSVPYTLKYTMVDLSYSLPDQFVREYVVYNYDGGVNYANSYVKDGKLFVYGSRNTENEKEAYLSVFENGQKTEEVSVPRVNGIVPLYAHQMRNGHFAVIYELKYRQEYFAVIDAQGDVIAEVELGKCLGDDYYLHTDFWLGEIEDGNVVYAINLGNRMDSVQFTAETGQITQKCMIYRNKANDKGIYLAMAQYLGNNRWAEFHQGSDGRIMDMNKRMFTKSTLRIPEDKDHMFVLYDADGNVYLNDMFGLYAFRDNLPPVRLANWIDCGVSIRLFLPNVWIIDERNFYVTKTKEENGITEAYLYYVHTEMVPDENTKQVIDLDYYGLNNWVRDAVLSFNRESEEYEINLNYVDVVGVRQEQLEAMLADRMLNDAHPDVILIDQRVSLDNYYDKNTFLDLTPYIGDQLLGCVRDAVGWGNALYSVPTAMQIYTFLCLPEITEDFLTWDVFIDSVMTLDGKEVLYSDPRAEQYLYENGIMDFFDLAAGEANYDSDKFRSVMELLDGFSEDYLDQTVGYLTAHSDRTWGYTNPTLTARLREGGLSYLNLWINSPEQVMMARLLFGENDFVWCGYPSEHGGGAYVNSPGRLAVLADTDVPEGSIEFVKFLFSAEQQSADTHENLPVTRNGIKALFEKNRYYSYAAERYLAIGDPAAPMREPTISFDTTPPIVPLSAEVISDVPIVPELDENGDPLGYCVELPQGDIDAFLYFLDNCHMSAGSDDTVEAIVTEELSYWQNGVKSLEEVTKIMQSRVSIYLAERQ